MERERVDLTRPVGGAARFADVLKDRAFAPVFLAESQSVVGDQLARVALAVFVFRETGSPAYTGLMFAATFLPAVVGGAVLGRLGDRYRRRAVMIAVDLIRGGLFAVMAVPGVPTGALAVLVMAAVFVSPLFSAAEVSYLAQALAPERFRVATGLRMLSSQGAQVVGFAAGGALVVTWGPRPVLLLDAATFVVSVLLVALVAPAERDGPTPGSGTDPDLTRGAGAVLWQDRSVRTLVGLSALAGLFVAPEGLAVPFADKWSDPAVRAGFLLAALPLGSVVGVWLLVRRVPPRARSRAMRVMAVACGLPLLPSAWIGGYPLVLVCWAVSGLCAAYQVEVISELVAAIPDRLRSRTLGICGAILLGAQGLGIAAFSGLGQALSPGKAVALAGATGSALALLLVWRPWAAERGGLDGSPRGGRHRRAEEASGAAEVLTPTATDGRSGV